MALHKLSPVKVKGLKKPGTYEDGGGLRLVVAPSGSKRWVMRISVHGKRQERGLGGYPATSLERARERAAEIRSAVAEGRDISPKRGMAPTIKQAFEPRP